MVPMEGLGLHSQEVRPHDQTKEQGQKIYLMREALKEKKKKRREQ